MPVSKTQSACARDQYTAHARSSLHSQCELALRGRALREMMMGPESPALVSATSLKWEWYIQSIELGSLGPGPARSVTCHTNVQLEPGGMMSSNLSRPDPPQTRRHQRPHDYFS